MRTSGHPCARCLDQQRGLPGLPSVSRERRIVGQVDPSTSLALLPVPVKIFTLVRHRGLSNHDMLYYVIFMNMACE